MKPIFLSFQDVVRPIPWPSLQAYGPDIVMAVERGGLMFGAIISLRLNSRFLTIRASLYDDSKPAKQLRDEPEIIGGPFPSLEGKKILIVDDVANSGKTLKAVKSHLESMGAGQIKTFVYAGDADYSCRPFEKCLIFPWEEK